jgi:hypothetical protein
MINKMQLLAISLVHFMYPHVSAYRSMEIVQNKTT